MSYWKLSVEGFGKIKKAEIELAPMTLFVGDNNSGKSYLLSLAWAMHQLSDELFQLQAVREMQSRELDYMKTIFLEAFRQAEDSGNISGGYSAAAAGCHQSDIAVGKRRSGKKTV